MEIIKPERLKAGDTIGIIAPGNSARYVNQESRQRAISQFESLGFKAKFGKNIDKLYGHAGGTIAERVDDLMGMFLDPEVRAIIAVYGGFNSHQLLEYLDFDAIRANPKIFLGFSDITSLNTALYVKSGLVNFSGPALVTFAQPELPDFTMKFFKEFLIDGKPDVELAASARWAEDPWWSEKVYAGRKWQNNPGWQILKPGKASGIVVGGNVGTLLLLAGTPYWPDLTGKILFVEDDEEENTATLDRYFTHLRHLGVYEQIKGMVIGRFPSVVGLKEDDSLKMIIEDATRGYDFPIISGVDMSHTDPLVTFPIGIECAMDTDDLSIRFLDSAVV